MYILTIAYLIVVEIIDSWALMASQSTQNICITFVQCWTNVEDVGPTLYKWYANVLCLLVWQALQETAL